MASEFLCFGSWVYFSNGATECFCRHWVQLLKEEPDTDEKRRLLPFLEINAHLAATGCGGFGMDRNRMPDEIKDELSAQLLLRLMGKTLEDLRAVGGVPWDDELVRSWKPRLWRLHNALAAWAGVPVL